jgi:mannose-6-phosphate isomerase-like protein (cupin superfamily)
MKTEIKYVQKRWGHEKWFANNEEENYCGKELFINEGKHTSMHFHLKKHEVFYIIQGILYLSLIDTKTGIRKSVILNTGDKFEVAQGQPHQLIAHNGPVCLIEASTFHEDSDSYRISDELMV